MKNPSSGSEDSLTVAPIASARGAVRLPGSKSISNRALLVAAMADGATLLKGLLKADDTDRMLESLVKLGVRIEQKTADEVLMHGCGFRIPARQADLFVGNAGTAARTLTALLAFAGGSYRLDGIARMRERPIGDLLAALRSLGARITCEMSEGFLPLRFEPASAASDTVSVRGSVSSQYLTALLLTAPHIAPAGGLAIRIIGELISRPYVAMTVAMMRDFGIRVEERQNEFRVYPGVYRAKDSYFVEGDASGASYFLALGALCEGPVRVEGVGADSLQGDVAFADALERMGARVVRGRDFIEVSGPADHVLRGIELDCTEIPDAAMTLVPMALKTAGPVHLRGIGSWRVKETDRIEAMSTEMRRFGASVQSGEDWIRVCMPQGKSPVEARVQTYDDHRMAMSLSLAACAGVPVHVTDPGCTAKTFPTYFEELHKLCRR